MAETFYSHLYLIWKVIKLLLQKYKVPSNFTEFGSQQDGCDCSEDGQNWGGLTHS